jgi:hypothetical protein
MQRAMSYLRFCMYDGQGFEPEWLQTRIQVADQTVTANKHEWISLESFPLTSYDNEQKMLKILLKVCNEMIAGYPVTYE